MQLYIVLMFNMIMNLYSIKVFVFKLFKTSNIDFAQKHNSVLQDRHD